MKERVIQVTHNGYNLIYLTNLGRVLILESEWKGNRLYAYFRDITPVLSEIK